MKTNILFKTAILIFTSSLAMITQSYAQAGSLDLSFNTTGKVTTPVRFGADGSSVAIQTDGKIVVAGNSDTTGVIFVGSNHDFAVVRYNIDGSLDSSFGSDGIVTTDFVGTHDIGKSVSIQSDGKIVVAGIANLGNDNNFAVVRYNMDGSLDSSFDFDGKLTTDFFNNNDIAESVSIQSDGKIVVTGYTANSGNTQYEIATVRYNTDGSLDNSFDSDGKVTTTIGLLSAYGTAIAIQSDGKIVVSGGTMDSTTILQDFALVRYNSNGSLDNTFDTDGIVTTDFGGPSDFAYTLAIQSDGKLVAAGESNNRDVFAIARYNTDGTLDNSFDSDGKVTTAIGSWENCAYDVVIQNDNKIVAAGYSSNSNTKWDMTLVRYNPNGSLDNTFDLDGIVTTAIGTQYDVAYGIALQTDGKIVVAGSTGTSSVDTFALARYNNDFLTSIEDENELTNNITIHPNPSSHNFLIEGRINNLHLIDMYDASGKLIFKLSGKLSDINHQLASMPDFTAGIYLINIKDLITKETKTEKLVKQ